MNILGVILARGGSKGIQRKKYNIWHQTRCIGKILFIYAACFKANRCQ